MKIKIVSLNIEGDKHLPEVIGLIDKERPDVVCLQEVFEEDFKMLVDRFNMRGFFAPMVLVDRPGKPGFRKNGVFGVAMIGKLPGKFGIGYYFKRRTQKLPAYGGKPNSANRVLVWQKIDGGPTVATTHFTWSKNGQITQKQRRELASLLKLLDKLRPDVVCGDFNAPRGNEIWSAISERLIDNIPPEAKTTLDPNLHYSHGVKLVVDGFFTSSTSKIMVKSLKLIDKASDHLAVSAIMQDIQNPFDS